MGKNVRKQRLNVAYSPDRPMETVYSISLQRSSEETPVEPANNKIPSAPNQLIEALAGKQSLEEALSTPTTDVVTGPVQEAVEELEAARLEKSENFASIQKEKELLHKEQEEFKQRIENKLLIPVKEIPSLGKLYPEGYEIYYTRYNLRDFEDLNNADLRLQDQYRIMLEGIVCRGMDKRDITYHDFNYISTLRRLESQGAVKFKHPYECVKCLKKGVHTFTLADITFKPLEAKLPIVVRFHSFPDELFKFVPHTVGDILRLIENRKYYRIVDNSFIRNEDGDKIIDSMALFACCCISHPWQEAYEKLIQAGLDARDRAIVAKVDELLSHDVAPITFKCQIPLDPKLSESNREEAESLVDKVISGDLSLNTANDLSRVKDIPVPDWLKALEVQKDLCGAENEVDVVGRDIIIPFREDDISSEYGIISE